jgi:hypothetical protein
MNAWSDYLREQAVIADRYAKTMTTAEAVKEFVDIAESFRRDADAEDANSSRHHRVLSRLENDVVDVLNSLML